MDRKQKRLIALILAGILAIPVAATESNQGSLQVSQFSLPQLENRLAEIDRQLKWLAPYSLRSGIGVIGYRSDRRGSADRLEWIEVELDKEYPIDEIVLVPTLRRDTEDGFRSDGFPEEFRIVAGTDKDREGTVIAEYFSSDAVQPRIGPLVVPLTGTTASWVRVEATHLSLRAFDGKPVFQIAEILLFSDTENVALRQRVMASSSGNDQAGAWNQRFAVDGHTPYLMDSSTGIQSVAFVSRPGDQPKLYLDLGAEYPISRIHLHAVDQGDTVPQAYAGDLGIPSRLRIEGASRADFKDAKTLLEYERKNINEIGPILMWRIPETTCRFVRLIAVKQDQSAQDPSAIHTVRDIRIGFAEVELFSRGENVAFAKRAYTDDELRAHSRLLSALTDGHNLFGKILPIRTWLNELAQRHDLEVERPRIVAELNHRYARQNAQLTWMTLLAALLVVVVGATILIDQIIRRRQLAELKKRFAADLHDELGANLHVIGLLGDLAQAAVGSPNEKLKALHQRIRVMTERSGTAVQYCTNMLESKELYKDLLADMQRTTERIMADLEGGFSFQGSEQDLQRLGPRTRADLFLFYKECLVNIGRHSQATQFSAQLIATPMELSLIVTDNGHGLTESPAGGVPPSLRRRAQLLGAQVTADNLDTGGTRITLNLRTRKWGRRK